MCPRLLQLGDDRVLRGDLLERRQLFAWCAEIRRRLPGDGHRGVVIPLAGYVHERLRHGTNALRRPPRILLGGNGARELNDLGMHRVEIGEVLIPHVRDRLCIEDLL